MGAERGAIWSPEEQRKEAEANRHEEPTQSRHLDLRRCISTAIFQPMGQIRKEVRLEARDPCRQDLTGAEPLCSGSQPPSLEALGDHYLERGKAGAETGTLDSVIFPGQ